MNLPSSSFWVYLNNNLFPWKRIEKLRDCSFKIPFWDCSFLDSVFNFHECKIRAWILISFSHGCSKKFFVESQCLHWGASFKLWTLIPKTDLPVPECRCRVEVSFTAFLWFVFFYLSLTPNWKNFRDLGARFLSIMITIWDKRTTENRNCRK